MQLQLIKYIENLSKKKRLYIPYEKPSEGVQELLKIEKAKTGWIGSFSISTQKTKIYNIQEPKIFIDNVELIGTEISKYILLLNQIEKGYRKETSELLERTPPPLYANPTRLEKAIYIDIKSCYYTLLKKLWGIKYARWKYVGYYKNSEFIIPQSFENILSEHKAIRNSLYGFTRTRTRTRFTVIDNKINFKIEKSKNELYYPDIALAIMDITQSIATIAVKKYNAIYVAIDGFIIPEKKLIPFVEFLYSIGLRTGIKAEGEVEVKNFYTYSFETLTTKNFEIIDKANEIKSNLIFNIKEAEEIIKKFTPILQQKK